MNPYLKITGLPPTDEGFVFISDLRRRVKGAGGFILRPGEGPHGGDNLATGILVALSSAGVFTAVYECIRSYLRRHQDRELHLESGDVKITVKGHGLQEELRLLQLLRPDRASKEQDPH